MSVVRRGSDSGHGSSVDGKWTKSATDLLLINGLRSHGNYWTTCQVQITEYEQITSLLLEKAIQCGLRHVVTCAESRKGTFSSYLWFVTLTFELDLERSLTHVSRWRWTSLLNINVNGHLLYFRSEDIARICSYTYRRTHMTNCSTWTTIAELRTKRQQLLLAYCAYSKWTK